jgi:hypothetical protein
MAPIVPVAAVPEHAAAAHGRDILAAALAENGAAAKWRESPSSAHIGRSYAEAVARLDAAGRPVIENFRGTLPVESDRLPRDPAPMAQWRCRGGGIMLRYRQFSVLCGMLAAVALSPSAGRADSRPIVVELFTSQGCSSCPPADKLLGELAPRSDVLALGFHISYWDSLGWKDPLSSQASTDRQKAYARRFSGGRVYTPQMVVEGVNEMVGSDRAAVLAALREAQPAVFAPVNFAADRRSVTVGAGSGSGEVLLVHFAQRRATQVGAGENAGRALEDINGVETLATLGAWNGAKAAFPIEPPDPGKGIAILVQAADGKILGAAAVKAEN